MSPAHAHARHGRAIGALRATAALAAMLSLSTTTFAQEEAQSQTYPLPPVQQPEPPPADAPPPADYPDGPPPADQRAPPPAAPPPPNQPASPADTPPAAPPAAPQAPATGSVTYRGFTIDVSAVRDSPRFDAIIKAVDHQVDIVAGCGARPDQLRFFQSREIHLQLPGLGPDHFNSDTPSVTLGITDLGPQRPVLLHQLLHAYHQHAMAGGFRNPDVLTFYNRAKSNGFYPRNAYVVRNVQEFFAVTGSLYLWGHVDRPPYARPNLKARQPVYYAWLGRLFGVAK